MREVQGHLAKTLPTRETEAQGRRWVFTQPAFPLHAVAAFQFRVLKFEMRLLSQFPLPMPAWQRHSFVAESTVISKLAVCDHLLFGAFPDLKPQQAILLYRSQDSETCAHSPCQLVTSHLLRTKNKDRVIFLPQHLTQRRHIGLGKWKE